MAHKTERKTIMKSIGNNNLIMTICASLIFFVSAPSVFAQTPDNAALLYYQAFLLYEKPDDTMDKMLSDFHDGKIKVNELIEQYIEKNHKVIDFIVKATNIPNCDWGYDYSQGFELLMPNLAQLRQVTYLIQAEAKLLAEKGDYKKALDRCLSMHKMAINASDKIIIGYLVAIAISGRANATIQDILKDMPEDSQVLNQLKERLTNIENKFPTLWNYIGFEAEMYVATMQRDKVRAIVDTAFDEDFFDPNTAKRILEADEEFFKRNRDCYTRHIADIQAVLDTSMSYPQAYEKLQELEEKLIKEAKEKDAPLAIMFAPAFNRIYSLSVRRKTHFNAVKAAIEVYIIKAKTGKLPDTLPAGLPGDLFSAKPFKYMKTADGFILRYQGEDLSDKDKKIYEYEFKVKK
jgi:hypothetical protein